MGGRVGNNASGSAIVVRRTTFDLRLPDLWAAAWATVRRAARSLSGERPPTYVCRICGAAAWATVRRAARSLSGERLPTCVCRIFAAPI